MLDVDASAGGGQLVRTALALACLEGVAIRLSGIRETRDDPGLAAQHLASVRALAAISDAEVEGAEMGATELSFEPGPVTPGRYSIDVGTAGSLTLLFDAILPLATTLEGHLAVEATGGTDVAWSPTMDWYRQVKLPLLRRHGYAVAVDVDRRGFYPAGGGRATMWLGPSDPRPFDLADRGEPTEARLYSVESADLAERDVADRQATAVTEALPSELTALERTRRTVETASTGSALVVRVDFGEAIAGVDALGAPGKPAEAVGVDAMEVLETVLDSRAPVDGHLGDQLAVLLPQAGGRVRIPEVSHHVETVLSLLDCFDRSVDVDRADPGGLLTV